MTQACSYAYFISAVINHRLELFSLKALCDAVIRNLEFYLKKNDFAFLGYVIMPDHYHLIIHPRGRYTIGDIVRDLHKYIAKEILELVENEHPEYYRRLADCKIPRKTRKHQVWRENPWIETVYSETSFRQKLNYIHNNPVRKQLVIEPAEYYYSSFRSLYLDDHKPIQVDTMWFPVG